LHYSVNSFILATFQICQASNTIRTCRRANAVSVRQCVQATQIEVAANSQNDVVLQNTSFKASTLNMEKKQVPHMTTRRQNSECHV